MRKTPPPTPPHTGRGVSSSNKAPSQYGLGVGGGVKRTAFALLFLLHIAKAFAQPFVGMNTSNYAGLYRSYYNPSALAGANMKYQVNLVTINSTINNRYFKYFASDALLHPIKHAYTATDMYGKSKLTGTFTQGTNMNVWSSLMGPSGFVGLGKKNELAIGLSTRMRGFVFGTGLPPVIAEVYTKRLDFGAISSSNGSFSNFNISQFSCLETAATVAYSVIPVEWVKIRAGGSVKFLGGGRLVYLNLKNANYQVRIVNKEEGYLDLTNVNYQYGFTNKVESLGKGQNYGSGLGFDVGVTLELGKIKNFADYRSNYIVRLGMAIADIGSIGFNQNTFQNYTGSLSKITFDQNKIIDLGNNSSATLESIFGTKTKTNLATYAINLPTTLNADFDLHLAKSFFINAAIYKPISASNTGFSLPNPQMISITPRFEDQDAQFTLPITWIEGNSTPNVGFSVRLGPAFIGFSNFSGMLKIHDPRGTFAFIGFQLFKFSESDKKE